MPAKKNLKPTLRKDGNPLVAFRAPAKLVQRFYSKHGGRTAAIDALRRFMGTSTRGAK